MTPSDQSSSLLECPRCGNRAPTIERVLQTCAFCRERARCIGDGKFPRPDEPTKEFPAWRADGMTDLRSEIER